MDFEELFSYLETEPNENLNVQNIECYINHIINMDLNSLEKQEDFITALKKVVVKKLGIFSECDYNDYQQGYTSVIDYLALKKYELRQQLQLSDKQQVYMISSEIEASEKQLQQLDIVEDITLQLYQFTNRKQIERIKNQIYRIDFCQQEGMITPEERNYQIQKIQMMRLWYDYNYFKNGVYCEEKIIDNERWQVIRLHDRGEILPYQYALYQSFFRDRQRQVLLEKTQIEKDYLQALLRTSILESQAAVSCGVFESVDDDYNMDYQVSLSNQLQLLNVQSKELTRLTKNSGCNFYSTTDEYHQLVFAVSKVKSR